MRYSPDDPAFADDFVEFSDSWSRAQVRAAWDAVPNKSAEAVPAPMAGQAQPDSEDMLLAALRPKIVALHLTCVDAAPITDASDLTPARTEQMDTRLYSWFANAWMKHLGELSTLGNALGGKLWTMSAGPQQAKATPDKKKPQQPAHRRR